MGKNLDAFADGKLYTNPSTYKGSSEYRKAVDIEVFAASKYGFIFSKGANE